MKPVGKAILACLFGAVLLSSPGVCLAWRHDSLALDDESVNCESCHTSTVPEHYKLAVCSSDDSCDHPVGAYYSELAQGDDSIKPAASLDPAVKLYNGRITCTTCHVPYYDSDRHKELNDLRKRYPLVPDPMLVVDNRQGRLCKSCHKK